MSVIQFNADPYTAGPVVVTAAAGALPTTNYMPSTGIGRGLGANMAFISIESTSVRYHMCGLTPAAGCGHLLVCDDYLVLDGFAQMNRFKVISTGGVATMVVTYFIG